MHLYVQVSFALHQVPILVPSKSSLFSFVCNYVCRRYLPFSITYVNLLDFTLELEKEAEILIKEARLYSFYAILSEVAKNFNALYLLIVIA